MNRLMIAGTAILGALLATPALAQDGLVAKKEAKLAEAWVKNATWILDYEEAQAAAAKAGKPIFAYFTRSYAP